VFHRSLPNFNSLLAIPCVNYPHQTRNLAEFGDGCERLKSGPLGLKDGFPKNYKPMTDISTGKFQFYKISLKADTHQERLRPNAPNTS